MLPVILVTIVFPVPIQSANSGLSDHNLELVIEFFYHLLFCYSSDFNLFGQILILSFVLNYNFNHFLLI